MHPGAGGMRALDDFRRGIEAACVHISRLDADDGRRLDRRQRRSIHSSLTVDRHAYDVRAPETEQGDHLEERGMRFLAGNDLDGRRTAQAVLVDVPTRLAQDFVASRGETREIRHRRAGHERAFRVGGKPENILQPANCAVCSKSAAAGELV